MRSQASRTDPVSWISVQKRIKLFIKEYFFREPAECGFLNGSDSGCVCMEKLGIILWCVGIVNDSGILHIQKIHGCAAVLQHLQDLIFRHHFQDGINKCGTDQDQMTGFTLTDRVTRGWSSGEHLSDSLGCKQRNINRGKEHCINLCLSDIQSDSDRIKHMSCCIVSRFEERLHYWRQDGAPAHLPYILLPQLLWKFRPAGNY